MVFLSASLHEKYRAQTSLGTSSQGRLSLDFVDAHSMCAQVILESEDLHRRAYNEAFAHFNIRCNGVGEVANWSENFYDMLQNRVGGGKQKMRW